MNDTMQRRGILRVYEVITGNLIYSGRGRVVKTDFGDYCFEFDDEEAMMAVCPENELHRIEFYPLRPELILITIPHTYFERKVIEMNRGRNKPQLTLIRSERKPYIFGSRSHLDSNDFESTGEVTREDILSLLGTDEEDF